MLRLTTNGVENIRPNRNVISSAASWDKINLVYQKEAASSNGKPRICIKFKEHGDRVYETPRAKELVAHIQEYMSAHDSAADQRKREDISIKLHKRLLLNEVKDRSNRDAVKSGVEATKKIQLILSPEPRADPPVNPAPRTTNQHPISQKVDQWLRDRTTKVCTYTNSFFSSWKKTFRKDKDCAEIARNLMYQLKDHVVDRKWKFLAQLAFKQSPDSMDGLTEIQRNIMDMEVERAIESYIVPQLLDDIHKHLRQQHEETTSRLTKNVARLKSKGLEHFHCSESIVKLGKLHNWDGAKLELSKIRRAVLPSQMIQVVFDTVQIIYRLTDAVNPNQEEKIFLSGEDLLPICIYVIIQASAKHNSIIFNFSDHAFISQLINRDTLKGEYDYYLTVFEAALCHILEAPVEKAGKNWSL